MMYLRRHYRTVVLSDIHLGTSHSKVEEVSRFLSSIDCERLILNGDIIDGWHIRKNGMRREFLKTFRSAVLRWRNWQALSGSSPKDSKKRSAPKI